MCTLDHIRKHVLDDAVELAGTTGIATPLMYGELDETDQPVPRFLLGVLARNVVLVVLRLHETPSKGKTGKTASIPALLELAVRGKTLELKDANVFKKRLGDLKANLERRGLKFSDLKAFRHAELAHSLHRTPSAPIDQWPVWEFAHDTYELVLDLDGKLAKRGSPVTANLDRAFHEWRDFGEAFWYSMKTD